METLPPPLQTADVKGHSPVKRTSWNASGYRYTIHGNSPATLCIQVSGCRYLKTFLSRCPRASPCGPCSHDGYCQRDFHPGLLQPASCPIASEASGILSSFPYASVNSGGTCVCIFSAKVSVSMPFFLHFQRYERKSIVFLARFKTLFLY